MRRVIVSVLAGTLFAGCFEKSDSGDRVLAEGELPVYSPDGKSLAFQRLTSDGMRLAVLSRFNGAVRWVDGAPGNAAQAAWNPQDGSLVYVYGNETTTAMEGLKGTTGWNLRIRGRDGGCRTLTSGRFWDYTPSFSSDGRYVYFVSTRGLPRSKTTGNVVYRMPAGGGEPETVLPFLPANNSGYSMPSVSPDGRVLVWAELGAQEGWHLMAARVNRTKRRIRLTDSKTVAYSPRWSPCGRYVCFTGFQTGDPGWCVYLTDVRTGACARLCEGREPAFSPDGRRLAFSRGGKIVEHVLKDEEYPIGGAAEDQIRAPSPKTLIRTSNPRPEQKVPLTQDCAFGRDETFYVRMRAHAPKKPGPSGVDPAVAGRYAEHAMGFQLLFHKGVPSFSLRTADGSYLPLCADRAARSDELVDVIGVRHDGKMFVWVTGGETVFRPLADGTLDLRTPQFLEVEPNYHGVHSDFKVLSVEVGRGWPADMPLPPSRKEICE